MFAYLANQKALNLAKRKRLMPFDQQTFTYQARAQIDGLGY